MMMAATMNATRVRSAGLEFRPLTAAPKPGTALVMTKSIGIINPEMPTGTHSVTQVMHAHTTTASVALPSGESPAGVGIT